MNIWNRFWNQASIRLRVLVGASLLLLPLSVLFYFNIEQLSFNIDFARKEMIGSQLQRPLLALLSKDPSLNQSADLTAFSESLNQTGIPFGWPEKLSERLSRLEAQRRKGDAASFEAWTRDIRSNIAKAGDGSNLTLDPERDSYHLADVSSVVTAQALERLNTVKSFLTARLGSQRMNEADRAQALVYRTLIDESDMQRIKGDLEIAIVENGKAARGISQSLKQKIEPLASLYIEKQTLYLALLTKLANGQTVSLGEIEMADGAARNSLLGLSRAVADELDLILEMRIAGYDNYRMKMILGTLIALALAVFFQVKIVSGITRPLADVVQNLILISRKDLTRDLPGEYLGRGDEIGQLAHASRDLSGTLNAVIEELRGSVIVLLQSATALETSSERMGDGVESTASRAQSTAVAAEELSSNINSIAIAMEEATTNFSSVADASAQMTETISEISVSSTQARSTTSQASCRANAILQQMRRLSESANAIGQVTDTIKAISAQTNLLALNASIEAARAGVAGKGFAVVAGEIKTLAQQTAAATEDIRTRIEGVQHATHTGTEEISRVAEIVGGVNELVNAIAAALEQQSMTTQIISSTISEAALGMQDANLRVAESSSVSLEIAKDAASVNQIAVQLNASNILVQSHANGLNAIARNLTQTIELFSVKSR